VLSARQLLPARVAPTAPHSHGKRLALHPQPWAVTRDTPIIALDAALGSQRAAAAAAASGGAAEQPLAEAGVCRCF
jgi:hypothetical protein